MFARKGIADARNGSGLRDHRVAVKAEEIQTAVSALKEAVTTPTAMEITGAHRNHFKRLVALGYLPTVTGSEKEAYAKHRFSREAIAEMMRRLFEGAVFVQAPTLSQMTIMEARPAAGASVDDILHAMFNKRLRWKGHLNEGGRYDDLLVDVEEIKALVRVEPRKKGLTKAEATSYIPGMGPSSVSVFIKNSILEIEDEFSPEARRLVTVVRRESADAFIARYVSLGELSRKSGLHHKKVRLLLRGAGILEAFDPKLYGGFFFERAKIKAAERSQPNFWSYDKAEAQRAARCTAAERR